MHNPRAHLLSDIPFPWHLSPPPFPTIPRYPTSSNQPARILLASGPRASTNKATNILKHSRRILFPCNHATSEVQIICAISYVRHHERQSQSLLQTLLNSPLHCSDFVATRSLVAIAARKTRHLSRAGRKRLRKRHIYKYS